MARSRDLNWPIRINGSRDLRQPLANGESSEKCAVTIFVKLKRAIGYFEERMDHVTSRPTNGTRPE